MRNPFLCLMVLCTATSLATFAQQEPAMTWPEMKPFKKIPPMVFQVKPAVDSANAKRSLINALYIRKWYHAGVQVDEVRLGKVYRMPVDNMLCLVPNDKNNSRMPVQKIKRMPEPMPNALLPGSLIIKPGDGK